MEAVLGVFSDFCGEHGLGDSHVDWSKGVDTLDYSGILGLINIKIKIKKKSTYSILNYSLECMQKQLCSVLSSKLIFLKLLGQLSRN